MACTVETGEVFNHQTRSWDQVEECAYSLNEVWNLMEPQNLDGDPAVSWSEQASFALAAHQFESMRGTYIRIFESQLNRFREQMNVTFHTLNSCPAPQKIWLTLDPEIRVALQQTGNDPDIFLDKMREYIEHYSSFENKKKSLNVEILLGEEPSVPHATVNFTRTKEALVRTREARVRAVQDLLRVNNPKKIKILLELIEQERDQEGDQAKIASDDLYDRVAQRVEFLDLISLEGGFTPMKKQDIGNQSLSDISLFHSC